MTVENITLNGTAKGTEPLLMQKKISDPPTTERIAESDMGYHKRIASQNVAIPQVREQIQGLQQTLMGIDGASRSWLAHLQEKYGLSEGDSVTADGEIVRQAPKLPDELGKTDA